MRGPASAISSVPPDELAAAERTAHARPRPLLVASAPTPPEADAKLAAKDARGGRPGPSSGGSPPAERPGSLPHLS